MADNKLTDESLMPMGKFKGSRMIDVSADYLLWLYNESSFYAPEVREYIEDNEDVLISQQTNKKYKQLDRKRWQ